VTFFLGVSSSARAVARAFHLVMHVSRAGGWL
jgi:hypothetical protein